MNPLSSRRVPRRFDRLFRAYPTVEPLERRAAPTGLWETAPPEHLFAEPLPIAILGESRPAAETPARPAQNLDGTFPDLQPLLTQLRLAPLAHDATPRLSSATPATAAPRPAVTFPAGDETSLLAAPLDAGDLLADPFGTSRATRGRIPSGFTLGGLDPDSGPDRAAAPDTYGLPDGGTTAVEAPPRALLTPLSGARDNRAEEDLVAALASGTPFLSGGLTLMSPATSSGTELLSPTGDSSVSAQAAAAPQGPGILVVGPDAGGVPRVKVYDTATLTLKLNFLAYPATFTGGVRVAAGDVTGDGTLDILTGPGPGGGALVKVFDGLTGNPLSGPLGGFTAYAPGQSDGVFVAAGDVNADGKADIITGTDVGAAPLVKVFSGADGSQLASFYADAATLTSGVRVAAGDVNADGKADVVTGAGPGGLPRVSVFDGGTFQEVYNFFAYDVTFRGGLYVAAGDVTGDGRADIVTGPGAGGRPEVRTYTGVNTAPVASFLAFETSFTGGVRVTVVDGNADGWGEIAAGAGPGGGRVQLFGGLRGEPLSGFAPYGGSFQDGLFVGAVGPAAAPIGPLSSHTTTVTVTSTTGSWAAEQGSASGVFLFVRTGNTSGQLTVTYTLGGLATNSVDYQNLSGSVTFQAGQASVSALVTPFDDSSSEGTETVVATLQAGSGYEVGSPSVAIVTIADNDGPPPLVPPTGQGGGCGGPAPARWNCSSCGDGGGDLVSTADGVPPSSGGTPGGLLRYADGTVQLQSCDLQAEGFGISWGHTRSWTNHSGYVSGSYGSGTVVSQLPYLRQDGAGTITAISNGTTARFFDPVGGSYQPRFFLPEQLSANGGAAEFVLKDATGQQLQFHDFTVSPTGKRGQLKGFTDPKGNVFTVTSYTSDGKVAELQRSATEGGTTSTESFLYTYLTSGPNSGKLSNVTLRRQTNGGPWSVVRQVDSTYYELMQSFGNVGDLKLAVVKDSSGATLETFYYRYYLSGQPNGYQGGLKYVFGPQSYARLAAAVADPFNAADAVVDDYADLYLEYG